MVTMLLRMWIITVRMTREVAVLVLLYREIYDGRVGFIGKLVVEVESSKCV